MALHGWILEWLRQQLPDEAMAITPMAQPLFLHVLQPVAPAAPPPQPHKKRRAPQPTATAGANVPAQPTDTAVSGDDIATQSDAASVPNALPQDGEMAAEAPTTDPAPPATAEPIPSPLPQVDEAAWPVDTRLSYSVKGYYRGDFYGWGAVQWQHSDGRYQVQVDMRLALLFTGILISQGELAAAGLKPRVYEERGMGRARHLAFDGTTVTLNDGSHLPQPQGIQDTASQFVELTHRFASGRDALVVGAEVPVWLARPREMYLWVYDVVALETLQLPELGDVPAYHLKPRPLANPRGVINAELWFAPSLQYLPVRIRVNLGSDNYAELTVKRIEQGAPAVNAPP